jgi:hypothetical protein
VAVAEEIVIAGVEAFRVFAHEPAQDHDDKTDGCVNFLTFVRDRSCPRRKFFAGHILVDFIYGFALGDVVLDIKS